MVVLFGGSDRALRLVPFLGGCLALLVFARLAHRLLSRPAALLATALAAFSPFLVYYTAESEQYSTDVLFTVVILDLAVVLLLRRPRPLHACAFGVAGAVGVICSHPAALVAGGVSLVLLSVYLARRDWRAVGWVAAGSSIWLATFTAEYFLLLRGLATDGALLAYWRAGFAPRPLAPGSLLTWLGTASLRVLANSLGFSLPGVAAVACLAGVLAVSRRRVVLATLLLAPLPLAVAAAVARKYPWTGASRCSWSPWSCCSWQRRSTCSRARPVVGCPSVRWSPACSWLWLPSSRSAGPSGPLRIRSTCPRHARCWRSSARSGSPVTWSPWRRARSRPTGTTLPVLAWTPRQSSWRCGPGAAVARQSRHSWSQQGGCGSCFGMAALELRPDGAGLAIGGGRPGSGAGPPRPTSARRPSLASPTRPRGRRLALPDDPGSAKRPWQVESPMPPARPGQAHVLAKPLGTAGGSMNVIPTVVTDQSMTPPTMSPMRYRTGSFPMGRCCCWGRCRRGRRGGGGRWRIPRGWVLPSCIDNVSS